MMKLKRAPCLGLRFKECTRAHFYPLVILLSSCPSGIARNQTEIDNRVHILVIQYAPDEQRLRNGRRLGLAEGMFEQRRPVKVCQYMSK